MRTRRAPSATALAVAVATVSVAAAAVATAATHNFSLPHNDDWSFSLTALDLLRTGHLHYFNWGQMSLAGQIAASAPFYWLFGRDETALQIFGLTASAAALVLTYFLARQAVTARIAVVATALVAVFPGFGLLSASYMTDLPALAGQAGCMLAGITAVRRRSLSWLTLSCVVGVWAFSIRQQSLVAIVAVAVALTVAEESTPRFRRVGLTAIGLAGVACLAIELWRRSVPGHQSISLAPTASAHAAAHVVAMLVEELFSLGFLISPLAIARVAQRRAAQAFERWWLAGSAVIGVVTLGFAVDGIRGRGFVLTVGNYLTRSGSYPDQKVNVVPVIPTWLWVITQLLAAAGAAVLVAELACLLRRLVAEPSSWRHAGVERVVLLGFGLLYSLALVAQAVPGQQLYDRYALPLIVPAAVVLTGQIRLAGSHRPATAPSSGSGSWSGSFGWLLPGAALLLMAVVSWVLTVSSGEQYSAAWHSALALERADQLRATQINAGLDWDGWHADRPAELSRVSSFTRPYPTAWMSTMFPGLSDCAVVSIGEISPPGALVPQGFSTFSPYGLSLATGKIYDYRRPRCPAP